MAKSEGSKLAHHSLSALMAYWPGAYKEGTTASYVLSPLRRYPVWKTWVTGEAQERIWGNNTEAARNRMLRMVVYQDKLHCTH